MGGINFVDIAHLQSQNIVNGRLIYTRRKTSKLINLPMQAKASEIIDKYKSSPYLFPILSSTRQSEQQMADRVHKTRAKVNRELKTIGVNLGIETTLTTYVARHSFATVLKRSGVATPIICESLGHSSEKVTQIYLDSFGNNQIDEAMKNLL